MPTYDAGWFTPPAPLARVRLRRPDTGAEMADAPMVLDTGADVSLVPRFCVTQLDMPLILPTGMNSSDLMDTGALFQSFGWSYICLGADFEGSFLSSIRSGASWGAIF